MRLSYFHDNHLLTGHCKQETEILLRKDDSNSKSKQTSGQSIEEKECSYGKDKSSIIWPKCPLDVLARFKSH